MISINENLCVIDGWVVDVVKQKVVSLKSIRSILTPDEKRKLQEIDDLKLFSYIDTDESVIVNSTSEELFHYIKTEDVEFVTLPGRVVKRNTRPHKMARKSVVNAFTLKCHPVSLGSRRKCYLNLSLPKEINDLQSQLYEVPVKKKKKDTSVYTNIVQVQEFNFTRDDYNILKGLVSKNNSSAKYIAGDMLKMLKVASTKRLAVLFGKSIHRGFDSFIKDLLPETLVIYGSCISYLLLVLKNCDRLSVFDNYRSTAERVANITRECHTAAQLAEVIGREVSVLSGGGGDVEFWMTWIFLGAFDFCSWENYDEECPRVPILNYKLLLDSLIWMFRFGGVLYGEDKQALLETWASVETSGNNFVDEIKSLQLHVSEEVQSTALSNANTEGQNNIPKDNILSTKILGDSLNDLTEAFDGYVKELSQWFTFANVSQLHFATVGATSITFQNDRAVVSILHNFKRNAFQNMYMKWREQGDAKETNILKRVKDIINDLNALIMVMVWISTGIPMMYPELAALTYAGSSRNIYIDQVKKRLYLRIKYGRSQTFTDKSLFMTDGVSKRLWWTIAILRPFAFATFNDEIDMYEGKHIIEQLYREVSHDVRIDGLMTDPEESINGIVSSNNEFIRQVREDISVDSETTAFVLKMFAFVDIKNHRLFDSSQTRVVLKITNHKTKPSHQNMSYLWNSHILPKLNLDVESSVSEDARSTTRIGRQTATVSRLSKGRELTFDEMSAAHQLFQKEIDAAIDKRKGLRLSSHS